MTLAEALVKTHRWMTLTAAVLITVCEVLVFTSQSARVSEMQANAGARSHAFAGAASIYRAVASGTRTGKRVR
jgi:hypothetical protein